MREKAKQIVELLKVLANENRLLIFCCLMEGPATVSDISNCVPNISRPALSQHLTLLKAHGILSDKKTGQNVTYFIANHRVDDVIEVLKKYYCEV